MRSTPHRICQFVPSVAPGDGVTGAAFYVERLLNEMGVESRIFSHRPPFELRQQVADIHLLSASDWDLVLVHHSMGHDLDSWLETLALPKVLLYHNITPEAYFAPGSGHHFFAIKGRQQLASWPHWFIAAIGMSRLNSDELISLGYRDVRTIPLLVDPLRWSRGENTDHNDRLPNRFILAVGRLARNKRQHLMVEALARLNALGDPQEQYHLILAGDSSDTTYLAEIHRLIADRDLSTRIHVTGKVSDPLLRQLYQQASALWCTSAHEGFGMPLIEACLWELPVVATGNPAVLDTLGSAGLVTEGESPDDLAAATRALLDDDRLRAKVVGQGRRNAERFSHQQISTLFADFLSELNLPPQERSDSV